MKFVDVSGGLGNQMFQYAFMLNFRAKGDKARIVPLAYRMKEHNGFELTRVFALPQQDTAFSFRKFLFVGYRHLLGLFPKNLWSGIDQLFGIVTVRQVEQDKFSPELLCQKGRVVFYRGAWQSEHYFEQARDRVLEIFSSFRMDRVSSMTRELLEKIEAVNAVSIHVRRGDYLVHGNLNGVCTLDYYDRAIQYMNQHVDKPHYYVFSDDLEWVKNNIRVENATFVDFNVGEDSWQDMLLMSRCKNNIIANSSFSWWGAYLNRNPNKIVVAPAEWYHGIKGEQIVCNQWIRM